MNEYLWRVVSVIYCHMAYNNKHLFGHSSLDWQFGYTQLGFF